LIDQLQLEIANLKQQISALQNPATSTQDPTTTTAGGLLAGTPMLAVGATGSSHKSVPTTKIAPKSTRKITRVPTSTRPPGPVYEVNYVKQGIVTGVRDQG
jgi:hypothetical protein